MLYINGRFLDKPISGVPLYGREVLKRLDTLENKDKIAVLIPKRMKITLPIKHLNLIRIGHFSGIIWEQLSLAHFMKKHKNDQLLNLCNLSPILMSSYVTIHDIGLIYNRGFKPFLFTLWYKFVFRATIKRAKRVFTVSEFCKNDIARYYKINKDKISVTYNGCEHIIESNLDDSLIDEYNLKNRRYYLFVGSNLPHKNIPAILKLASDKPNELFVIATDKAIDNCPKNIIFVINASFPQLKSLYKNAYCFILLSKFEGFGIPPLEAALCGSKHILLSNIPAFEELYSDMFNIVDISKPIYLPNQYKTITTDTVNNLKKKYSWNRVVETIVSNIK